MQSLTKPTKKQKQQTQEKTMSTLLLTAAARKQAFLNQFVCDATRAYASALYDLEAASIEKHDKKVSERVLDIC